MLQPKANVTDLAGINMWYLLKYHTVAHWYFQIFYTIMLCRQLGSKEKAISFNKLDLQYAQTGVMNDIHKWHSSLLLQQNVSTFVVNVATVASHWQHCQWLFPLDLFISLHKVEKDLRFFSFFKLFGKTQLGTNPNLPAWDTCTLPLKSIVHLKKTATTTWMGFHLTMQTIKTEMCKFKYILNTYWSLKQIISSCNNRWKTTSTILHFVPETNKYLQINGYPHMIWDIIFTNIHQVFHLILNLLQVAFIVNFISS